MRNNESKLQQACIKWFRLQYPHMANELFAIPNGGNRSPVTGAILKAEGVTAGVADLFLMTSRDYELCYYNGLFVEIKTETGRQQPSQKQFQSLCGQNGYRYVIVRSLDEFMAVIKNYLGY